MSEAIPTIVVELNAITLEVISATINGNDTPNSSVLAKDPIDLSSFPIWSAYQNLSFMTFMSADKKSYKSYIKLPNCQYLWT